MKRVLLLVLSLLLSLCSCTLNHYKSFEMVLKEEIDSEDINYKSSLKVDIQNIFVINSYADFEEDKSLNYSALYGISVTGEVRQILNLKDEQNNYIDTYYFDKSHKKIWLGIYNVNSYTEYKTLCIDLDGNTLFAYDTDMEILEFFSCGDIILATTESFLVENGDYEYYLYDMNGNVETISTDLYFERAYLFNGKLLLAYSNKYYITDFNLNILYEDAIQGRQKIVNYAKVYNDKMFFVNLLDNSSKELGCIDSEGVFSTFSNIENMLSADKSFFPYTLDFRNEKIYLYGQLTMNHKFNGDIIVIVDLNTEEYTVYKNSKLHDEFRIPVIINDDASMFVFENANRKAPIYKVTLE